MKQHIENDWQNYKEMVYPNTILPDQQYIEIKQAYLSGQLSVYLTNFPNADIIDTYREMLVDNNPTLDGILK
jgi:hypothetical protein